MGKVIFLVMVTALAVGCTRTNDANFDLTWPPVETGQEEKAHSEFLQRPIVKEFQAEGLSVECDWSICASVTDASLTALKQYMPQFLERKDRIRRITLFRKDYPAYNFGMREAHVPAQLTEPVLQEFFEVFNLIRTFEEEAGFRVEFPNNRYLKASVSPFLEILKDNSASLKKEAHRFDILVVSADQNQFLPGDRFLLLKAADLKESFRDLWSFMSLYYKAQDLFGNVSFDLSRDESYGIATMKTLFQYSSTFQPLFAKLQERYIRFYPLGFEMYVDSPNVRKSLTVSSDFDENYLETVFKDQIRVNDLSQFIGKRILHTNLIIELEGHGQCLDKIESIKESLKAKALFLEHIEVGWGTFNSEEKSSYAEGGLFVNCKQTAQELETVLSGIK